MKVEIWVDGSCHNLMLNGGSPMGVGLHLVCGDLVIDHAYYVGLGTNNIAEWQGLVLGFEEALKLHKIARISELVIYSDSQIIVYQYNGKYAVNNQEFLPFYTKAKQLEKLFGSEVLIKLEWIPREQNNIADKLSKLGRDKKPA